MKRKISIKFTAISLAILLLSTGCIRTYDFSQSSSEQTQETITTPATSSEVSQTEAMTEPPVAKPDSVVTFVAAGDNLIHSNIYQQAQSRANGNGYDFTYAYDVTSDLIKNADIAFVNQETVVNNKYEPSNYPRFSTPLAMGDFLEDFGFDVISMANNHALDVNSDGLLNSLDYWKAKKVVTFGAYENQADYDNIRISEKNGITFSFIGVTEHTNGLKLPKDSDIKILYIGKDDELIEERIKKAREISDVVVVAPHFGKEVSDEISDIQRKYTKKFSQWGADVILGTQSHTIQPIELIKKADGSQTLVFYGLGNYFSSMTTTVSLSVIGMIGQFTVTKSGETGKITFSDIGGVPIISHYGNNFANAKIFLYKDYTEELALAHGGNRYGTVTKAAIEKQIQKVLGNYVIQ